MKIAAVGTRFGRLTVVTPNSWKHPACLCRCECDRTITVNVKALRSGNTKSCGCLRTETRAQVLLSHGHTSGGTSPTYRSWANMLSRCRHEYFPNYHARGITVCDRWRDSFEAFLADMGERPKGTSIERIDNSKGYELGNCCWATRKRQARNTRRNKYVSFKGETRALSDWAEHLGLNYGAVKQRINKLGWNVERAFTTPVRACIHE